MSDQSTADRAWQTFLSTVWRPDFDGTRHDAAPGETFNTVKGVTEGTWQTAQNAGVVSSSTALDDSTDNQLAAVIRWACWRPLWCDQLAKGGAPGVAIVLANMAMAAGAYEAVTLLQRTLGDVDVDGAMGPHTCVATIGAMHNRPDLIHDLTVADEAFFHALAQNPRYAKFEGGWDRRAEVFEAVAKGFA